MTPSPTSPGSSTPNNHGYDVTQDGPTRHGPRKRRKITRSKLGCLTCRRRKKLCNMAHPVCESCSRLGRECEWPTGSPQTGSETPEAGSSTLYTHGASYPSSQSMAETTTIDDFHQIFGGMPTNGLPTPSSYPLYGSGLVSGGIPGDQTGVEAETIEQNIFGGRAYAEATWDASSILEDLFNPNIDEATLQFWTAYQPTAHPQTVAPSYAANGPPIDPALFAPPLPSPDDALIEFYRSTPALCAVDPSSTAASNVFHVLATSDAPSSSRELLRTAIVALSAWYKTNKGEAEYEILAERKEEQARQALERIIGEREVSAASQTEDWTLFAGVLVMIRVKECRGSISGHQTLFETTKSLVEAIMPNEGADVPSDSLHFGLVEATMYRDFLNTFVIRDGPVVAPSILNKLVQAKSESLTPVLGISFSLLSLMRRVIDLVRRRRSLHGKTWDDDQHVDMVEAADELQDGLREEKKRLDILVKDHPEFAPHRFLHESYRTACLLLIRGYVLYHTPLSVDIGLLVRQNLSLLETMYEQKLPGLGSIHWVLFVTAISCIPAKSGADERVRALKLYQLSLDNLSFLHFQRSRRIVEEVWKQNSGGERVVDWINIAEQWEWEMFFT